MNPEPDTSSLDLVEERIEPYSQGNYRRTYTDFRTLDVRHRVVAGDDGARFTCPRARGRWMRRLRFAQGQTVRRERS